MIPERGEIIHPKETPLGRKAANLKNKSTKEATQKSRKIDCPPDLIAQSVSLLAGFSDLFFCLPGSLRSS